MRLLTIAKISSALFWLLSTTLFGISIVQVDVDETNVADGTYVDCVNITSTSGYLDLIVIGRNVDEDANYSWSGHDITVRVTIDGGSATTYTELWTGGPHMQFDTFNSQDAGGSRNRHKKILFRGARFLSSLHIEVKQDTGGAQDFAGIVLYRTD